MRWEDSQAAKISADLDEALEKILTRTDELLNRWAETGEGAPAEAALTSNDPLPLQGPVAELEEAALPDIDIMPDTAAPAAELEEAALPDIEIVPDNEEIQLPEPEAPERPQRADDFDSPLPAELLADWGGQSGQESEAASPVGSRPLAELTAAELGRVIENAVARGVAAALKKAGR